MITHAVRSRFLSLCRVVCQAVRKVLPHLKSRYLIAGFFGLERFLRWLPGVVMSAAQMMRTFP